MELKPLPLSDLKLEATAKPPRKKSEKLVFKAEQDFFNAKYNPQGASHYELEINLSYKGKKEKTKLNIEP